MSHSRSFGVFCLVLASLLWSCTPVFVKHFACQEIHADVQNLFRYISATLGLWVIVIMLFGAEALRAWRRWHVFLLPAAINSIFQVILVRALYLKTIFPTFSSLLGKSSVVFAVVLAFAFFRDERRAIRSWRYLLGSALAIAGVMGVVLLDPKAGAGADAAARSDLAIGVVLILSQAFLWACYSLAMKRVVRDTRPLVGFAMVATFTTLFFAVLTSIRSDPAQFLEIATRDKFLMILSGVAFISGAHSLYFRAVERLGVSICASFTLTTPLSTGLISWAWHGEQLLGKQILMGGVLLAGAFLVVMAWRRSHETTAELASASRPGAS